MNVINPKQMIYYLMIHYGVNIFDININKVYLEKAAFETFAMWYNNNE